MLNLEASVQSLMNSRLVLKLLLMLTATGTTVNYAQEAISQLSTDEKNDLKIAWNLGFKSWTNPETNQKYLQIPMQDGNDKVFYIKGPVTDLNVKDQPWGHFVSWKTPLALGGVHVDTSSARVYGKHINFETGKETNIRGRWTNKKKSAAKNASIPEVIPVKPHLPFTLGDLASDMGFYWSYDSEHKAHMLNAPGEYDKLGGDNITLTPHLLTPNGAIKTEGIFQPARFKVLDNGYYMRINSTNGKLIDFCIYVNDEVRSSVRIRNSKHAPEMVFNGSLDFSDESRLPYSIEYDNQTRLVQVKRLNAVIHEEKVNLPYGVQITNCRDHLRISDPFNKSDFKKLYGTDPILRFSIPKIDDHTYIYCPIPSGGDYIAKPLRLLFR